MDEKRIILHSDLNAFYASVETVLHPEYLGRAIAVCGSTEERHGIVLAKSEAAKRAGITTGMLNSEALARCPGLIIVPPHFEEYARFSRKVRKIYERYTDLVEPFGMDECWLDVSGSTRLFGSGESIAEQIRETVKRELGLTVSVGVSFNKAFAKLASDLKKPDAVTVIPEEYFREKLYPLPIGALLYAGRATVKKLNSWGIHTIGELAAADPETVRSLLGVNGWNLWNLANGRDFSRVCHKDCETPLKSLSRGVTCISDLTERDTVRRVLLELSQELGGRLREERLSAFGVQLFVKQNDLSVERYSLRLSEPTQSPSVIAGSAEQLFDSHYRWRRNVRALTVSLSPLVPEDQPFQPDFFRDSERLARREQVDRTVHTLRRRFGERAVIPAELLLPIPVSRERAEETVLPGTAHR